MKLTRAERWILSNQCRILEALYPDEAESIAEGRVALEQGYELHYDWLSEHIWSEDSVMSEEDCREILAVLNMFSALKRSYAQLEDKSGIDERDIVFSGFDGNSETRHMVYASYFCGHDRGRYRDLKLGDDFNGHMPMLDTYRRMAGSWNQSPNKNELTREDILRIAAARRD